MTDDTDFRGKKSQIADMVADIVTFRAEMKEEYLS